MPRLNADIILELAQYLDILTLLSLAQSCSTAFRASQQYSFWSPHELPPSVGLAVFLPDDHLDPWKSYSGDEIRQATIKMRDSRSNWGFDQASASHRVNVGLYASLKGIPGSRWLCAFEYGMDGGGFVRIVDGKTGISTTPDLDVDVVGSLDGPQFVGYSLEPNRILMGCTNVSYDDEASSCALFEIILSMNENDGDLYLEAHTTRIRLWKNMPLSAMTFMVPEFFVIQSKLDDSSWELYVYHLPSMRHWEWRAISKKYDICLVDQWCIFTKNLMGMIDISAIHLPSLLCLPETTSQALLPGNTIYLRTGEGFVGDHYTVDIIPSRDSTSRQERTSEYTVILSRATRTRFSFDIQINVVPGSIHGNLVWPGTKLPLPTNHQLEERVSSQFASSASGSPNPFTHGSTTPVSFVATQSGIEVLVIGFVLGNNIQILKMTNLRKSYHTRTLSWKAPLKRAGGTVEMDDEDDLDEIRALPYWDAGTGMLLLRGPPLSGGLQKYQTCWF